MILDHPIFLESIAYIHNRLGESIQDNYQQKVLERLIHASGDFGLQDLLKFSDDACNTAIQAIRSGAPILTDTKMAQAGIKPLAQRISGNKVFCILDWIDNLEANEQAKRSTRTELGLEIAWNELSNEFVGDRSPIVVIGSSPTALKKLLQIIGSTDQYPSLIIGMPVGFIGVEDSKNLLKVSKASYIMLESTRGGAGLAAAAINALLRESIE
tara:strand:- start:4353 stop:4991 length:639 start_codon:yes stop_codon:yes gene_type:complete